MTLTMHCLDSLRRPTLETELAITHAALIAGYEKEIYDFPEHGQQHSENGLGEWVDFTGGKRSL